MTLEDVHHVRAVGRAGGGSDHSRDDIIGKKGGWKSWLRLHSLRKLGRKNVHFLNNRGLRE